jgi:(p)ppGpp synthase/HD superfamily hydrolase
MTSHTDILRAFAFAAGAHAGQVRKYTGEPYVEHCDHVADILAEHDQPNRLIVVGLLHDTIEDTAVTYTDLVTHFDSDTAELVWHLTDETWDDPKPNRAVRKYADARRLAAAPADVQTVKLADLISNTSSIVEHDPKFAVTYLFEKRHLLDVMTRGDASLHARATAQIKDLT